MLTIRAKKIIVTLYLMFCLAPYIGLPPFDFLARAESVTLDNGMTVDVQTDEYGRRYYVVQADMVTVVNYLDENNQIVNSSAASYQDLLNSCERNPPKPIDDGGIFTKYQNFIKSLSKGAMTRLSMWGHTTVMSLIIIEMVMMFSQCSLSGWNFNDMLWKVVKWGLFLYFIFYYQETINNIYDGFLTISKTIAPQSSDTNSLIENPSSVFSAAQAATAPITHLSCSSEVTIADMLSASKVASKLFVLPLASVVLSLAIYLLYFFLALSSISAQCIFWMTAAVGPIFFPFMLLPQTHIIAGNVPQSIFAGALRICTLNLVLNVGNAVILSSTKKLMGNVNNITLTTVTWYACILLLFCVVAHKIPNIVTKAIMGQTGGGLGLAGGFSSAMKKMTGGN